jgi:hypothetical protein
MTQKFDLGKKFKKKFKDKGLIAIFQNFMGQIKDDPTT